MRKSNGRHIFSWGNITQEKRGFYITLSYRVNNFKQGKKIISYSYDDSLNLGFNNSIPEKRYLTYRSLVDER